MSILYMGWIDASERDREKLIALGVKGEMIYSKNDHCFEYCEADETTIRNLKMNIKNFTHHSFTAYDSITGENLPNEKQKYW